jgi:predicted TIM-barrel fold metal-dependent hydrolase
LISGAIVSAQTDPDHLLLKDYQPRSIYKIPATNVAKAKYLVIDLHSHPYAKTKEQIQQWVANMDDVGVQKTIILTMVTGSAFDNVSKMYMAFPDRFEMWSGLDFSNYDSPAFETTAIAELERCYRHGAKGVGELHDKGEGLAFGKKFARGLHADDPRMDPIWEKCADLNLPVSIHVSDPQWMYEPMDAHNDGLMNAYTWRRDNKTNLLGHDGLVHSLEVAVRKHPRTTFIACLFANPETDLNELGRLLDTYPNLYADIAARYGETAPIPRFVSVFYARHISKLVYGTDMGFDKQMYRGTFRILETLDEHFYDEEYGYHWALSGFGLSDDILKQLYRDNALKILEHRSAPQ